MQNQDVTVGHNNSLYHPIKFQIDGANRLKIAFQQNLQTSQKFRSNAIFGQYNMNLKLCRVMKCIIADDSGVLVLHGINSILRTYREEKYIIFHHLKTL